MALFSTCLSKWTRRSISPVTWLQTKSTFFFTVLRADTNMMIFHGQFVCCFSVRNNKLSGDGEPARIIKKIHIEGPAAAGGITTRQLQVSCVQRRVAAGGLGCKACSAGGGRAGTMLRTCVFVFSSSLFAEPTRRRITRSSSSSDNQLLRTCFSFALRLSLAAPPVRVPWHR